MSEQPRDLPIVNPTGEMMTCVKCRVVVTFTKEGLCKDCFPRRKLPPTKPEVVER